MREYVNEHSFDRRRQRKKSRRRYIRKCRLMLFIVCSNLIIVVVIALQLGNIFQSNTVEQPFRFSDAGTSVQETDLDNSANGIIETGSNGTNRVETGSNETSWCLILLNRWNYIPNDYKVELTELDNGVSVDTRIYPALQKMFDSARSENIYPIVASGYRTTEKQQSLMDEKINDYENEGYSAEEAKTKAEEWVAIPGTSEHQLGIAVDINADGIHSTGNQVYGWLDENAYKYGFIRRYSSDKTEITGVINEPWHYRYVGIDTATEIQNQGVCLEEYLGMTN